MTDLSYRASCRMLPQLCPGSERPALMASPSALLFLHRQGWFGWWGVGGCMKVCPRLPRSAACLRRACLRRACGERLVLQLEPDTAPRCCMLRSLPVAEQHVLFPQHVNIMLAPYAAGRTPASLHMLFWCRHDAAGSV